MKIYIEGSEKVDSLPYIDSAPTPEEQNIINALIQEEMGRFTPPNYLDQLPPMHTIDYSKFQFLGSEMSRLEKGDPIQPLNLTRYKVEQPSNKNDLQEWNKAVDNAKAQFEHQENRKINLQLLSRYGSNQWKQYLDKDIESIHKQLKQDLKSTREEIERVNMSRKLQQEQQKETLEYNDRKWFDLVTKNKEIERECLNLENEIHQIEQQLAKKTS